MPRARTAVSMLMLAVACRSEHVQVGAAADDKALSSAPLAENHRIRISVVCDNPTMQSTAELALRRGLGSEADIDFVAASFEMDVRFALAEFEENEDVVAISACVLDTPSGEPSCVILHDVRAMNRAELVAACERFGRTIADRCFLSLGSRIEELRRQGESDLIDDDFIKSRDRR